MFDALVSLFIHCLRLAYVSKIVFPHIKLSKVGESKKKEHVFYLIRININIIIII